MADQTMPRLPPGQSYYDISFGPKANCTLDICMVERTVYGYRPNLAANIVFLVLYVISGLIHLYLGFRSRSWFYTWSMVIGAVNAVVGYSGRIMMYYNPFSFPAFMIQIICITSGPVYYTAAIYVTLAAMINYLSPSMSRFPPKYFYWVFIPGDIACLVMQSAGGALSTSSAGSSQTGVDLALVGLSLQVVLMVAFMVVFLDYLVRYLRSPLYSSQAATGGLGIRLRLFFGFISSAFLLILVRCAYRLAELHEGYRGEMIRDEALFIGLEGVMVILAVYFLMVSHPGFVFQKKYEHETARLDSVTSEKPQ
ncbi:hypothetical protein PG987_007816 [Apiospora arundinis]